MMTGIWEAIRGASRALRALGVRGAVDRQFRRARVARGLGGQVPEALRCLEDGFAAATQFYASPREHWARIRSTNGLERLDGEVKRRTRSIGAFPDRDSALRLVTAVALETAHVWVDRRYLDMSLLKTEQPKVVGA